MKKLIQYAALSFAAISAIACTRIETGEVGVRVNMSKEVEMQELPAGSWNQTIVGSVLTFPVRDISVNILDAKPLTADNSALADFDLTFVYGINQAAVSELWTKKSRGFHTYDEDSGDWFLMYNYLRTLVNNASFKAIRNYKALEVADSREKLESEIMSAVNEQLRKEGLGESITLSVIQVRNIVPNQSILQAATEFVRAQNELKVKETEVQIAKKEAERMQMLAQGGSQSIEFMNAKARMTIAEAVAAGKVNTIVIPQDFKGFVNVK